MTTMFQRLIHASKLQRRNIHSSKIAFSQPLIPIAIGRNLNFSILTSLFLLLTSLFVNNGWGQANTIFSCDFEGTWPGSGGAGGTGWGRSAVSGAASPAKLLPSTQCYIMSGGTNCIVMDDYTGGTAGRVSTITSSAVNGYISLANTRKPQLMFDLCKMSTGTLAVQYDLNSSGTWTNLVASVPNTTNPYYGFSKVVIDLSSLIGQTQIRLRWSLTSSGFSNSCLNAVFIDNVQVVDADIFFSSGSWSRPEGVFSVLAECWGGGGAGGSATSTGSTSYAAGGGGAGGAYARGTVAVSGASISYTVGAQVSASGTNNGTSNGNPTWFNSTSDVYAPGGNGGQSKISSNANGNGGAAISAGAIGSQVYYSSAGSNGVRTSFYGGPGSNSAGKAANGNANSGRNPGNVTVGGALGGGGGFGGTISDDVDGASGSWGGGGGGGAYSSGTGRSGGRGGRGMIMISYCAAPTTQATNVTTTTIGETTATISWTNGNGAGRAVFINTSNSFTGPTSSNPSANTVYGGSGEQCIYNGTNNSVSITGLSANSTYWVRVYEYCSSEKTFNMNTSTNNANSFTTTSAACSALTSAGTVSGNQTICSGGDPVAFTSSADASGGSGGTITYQWQSSTDNVNFSNITSNGTSQNYDPPSGLSTTTYYRRQAKRCTGGMEVTSNVITVTVDAAPSVPGSVTTSNVGCTSLTLNWGAATNASGYEIQVSTQSNFSNSVGTYNGSNDVGNVTAASITGLSANTPYWIRVRARNGSTPCRSNWTNLGTISVTTIGNTGVSTQPSNATICFGGSNSPSVVGSGGVTLSYQWQFNNSGTWGSVSNGTPANATYSNPNSNNTFSIGGNISAGSYQYRCVVSSTGGCSSTNSNTATLTINADPSAPTATKSPNSASACAGATLTLSSPTYGADAGMSCGFEYSSSTDGASWSGYGDAIPSFTAVAGTNGIRIRVKGGCGNGCNASSYTEYTWTVTALPTITASSGASRCGTGTLGISATAIAGSIEWFNASSSGVSQGTSSSGVSWTTPSISATTTYYAEAVNGSCRSAARTAVTATVNTAAYRSVATGNWSDATKWEISCDGTNWTAANVAPGSGDGAISIRNGHNMAVAASASVDELTIDAGATLTVNSSQTLTIANGTGDDLTVNGSIIINGTISNSGAIKLNSGGLYNHSNGTSIPSGITFASGSTLEVSASATCTNIHSYSSRPHHLTWSSSGAMPTGTTSSGDALTLCSGDFTLSNGSFLANNNGSGSNYSTVSIGGNLNLSSSGIIRVIHNSNGSNSQGVGQINVSGNFNMTGGTFDFSNSSNATTGAKLNVSGNFSHTDGTITASTQPSSAQINLTGISGTQTIESTGQSCSVTFNVAGSNAQCVVAALKTFVQSANTTFTIADGTSTPDLLINGTFTRTGTSLTTTGTMSVASGGTYQHNCNGQALPSATWDAASRCNITGTSSTTPTNFGQTFGDLTVNCSGTATTDANSTVAGNLTVSGGTLTVGNNFTLGITGNSSITGTLTLGGTGAKTFSGNATIISSGTLNVSGSGAYSLAGNFTNNGTFTPGSAILTLNGGGAQTLDGSSALSFSNVTINKSGGTLTAAKDMTITGTLTLTSGILDMNSKTLTMGTSSANGTITGGSASSYILALDATTPSKLIHRVNSTANATYSFPIGTGSKYTPVTVVMKGGTLSNASIQVWTKNSKVTGMSNAMSCHLNRSWFVEPSGTITSPTYDIQLGFASGDFTGDAGFDLNPVKLSSGIWYKPSGSLLQNGTTQGTTIATTFTSPSTPTSSSGTVYWNGLTSFSEFGGGGGSAPLPVELVSFSGSCEDGNVHLSWQTASEFNSSHFDVEKSRDGENWQVIETIPAAGNSHELLNYETFDQVSNALNYYRLNQVDIDGTNKRYDPIAVSCEASSNGIFITYPNPSNDGFNILINDNELEGEMNMNIYTATGSITLQKRIVVKEGINVFMMNEKLLPGVYFIEVKDQQNKTKVIKHLVN